MIFSFLVRRREPGQLKRTASFRYESAYRPGQDADSLKNSPVANFPPAHRKLEPQQFYHLQTERLVLIRAQLEPLNVQLKSVAGRLGDEPRGGPHRPPAGVRLQAPLATPPDIPPARRERGLR